MLKEKFIILKAFNHNVLYCTSLNLNKECILIGKGIGFKVEIGSILNLNESIQKVFFLNEESNLKRFNDLTSEVEDNIVGVTEEIIAMISPMFKTELNEKLHITLLDHINFAIKRQETNIKICNPFINEIRFLYNIEYKAAEASLKLLNDRLKIDLPEDEIGFITMHIHAALKHTSLSKATLNTQIISESIVFIEEETNIKLDKDSIHYGRMITHLRFAIDRVNKNIKIENIMLNEIKDKCKETFYVSNKLADNIRKEYNIEFSEDEVGYLAVHIQNILNECTIKKPLH